MSDNRTAILVPGKIYPRVLERLGGHFDVIAADRSETPRSMPGPRRACAVLP